MSRTNYEAVSDYVGHWKAKREVPGAAERLAAQDGKCALCGAG